MGGDVSADLKTFPCCLAHAQAWLPGLWFRVEQHVGVWVVSGAGSGLPGCAVGAGVVLSGGVRVGEGMERSGGFVGHLVWIVWGPATSSPRV